MNLHDICKQHGGHFDSDCVERDCWRFHTAKQAIAAAAILGALISLDEQYLHRQAMLYTAQRGGLAFGVEKLGDEPGPGEQYRKKSGFWRRTFKIATQSESEHLAEVDALVRYCQPPGDGRGYWRYCEENGTWHDCDRDICRLVLYRHFNKDRERVDLGLGAAVHDPWDLVRNPFQAEYLPDRTWNLDAPQLAYKPSEGPHPHWDLILAHVGADLDAPLKQLAIPGITSGAEYIRLWLASLIQRPTMPLPYLFLFGEQNSGKSTLHEVFTMLVTRGVVMADRALTSDFNGELAYAVLAVVEETNVAKNSAAYGRVKSLVTSQTIAIRRMRCDQFELPNTCHWIQCANDRSYCPIFPGDSRITMVYVPVPAKDIPKSVLIERCREEAAAFTYTLLNMVLPKPDGRLGLPVVSTTAKELAMDDAAPALARAVAEFMEDKSDWSGTSTELLDVLASDDRLPTHGRVIRRELENAGPYLTPRGITVAFGKKTNKGQLIHVTRA